MRWVTASTLLFPVVLASCWHEPAPAKPTPPPQNKPTKEIVQPVKIEKQEVAGEDPLGDPCGDPCGGIYGGGLGPDPCGSPGGVVGGVAGGPPPPPPPPPPAPPQNVPPTLLEGNRISGDKNIFPTDMTKVEIARAGKEKLVGSFKLCITAGGDVASVNQLKSTGFPGYDTKIMTEMRQWKYRPFMVNGKAVPVCTAVTFIYSQPLPPPPPPKP